MNHIVIIGATSAIAQAVAKHYVTQDTFFILVARNSNKLEKVSNDLITRGAKQVNLINYDFDDIDNINECIDKINALFSHIDIVLIAHGILPGNNDSFKTVQQTFRINTISTLLLMENIATTMQSNGVIAVISSVAADRGRQNNYLYAASKAAVDTFASGLRNRLYKNGVHLLVIKPGFIDTPMTAHLNRKFFPASPESIAPSIVNAIKKKKNTLYTPRWWWLMMLMIKHIPEFIFKRMNI